MFFCYNQNNSGGSFDVDLKRGIAEVVIIEAPNARQADSRAEYIGMDFSGKYDCPCCGNRWHEAWENDGSENPEVYGKPVQDFVNEGSVFDKNVVVHDRFGKFKVYSVEK